MSLKKMNCFGLCQLTIKFKEICHRCEAQGEKMLLVAGEMCSIQKDGPRTDIGPVLLYLIL